MKKDTSKNEIVDIMMKQFDKMDRRFASEFEKMDDKFTSKFEKLDGKFASEFEKMDDKFTTQNSELAGMIMRELGRIDQKFSGELTEVKSEIIEVKNKLENVEKIVTANQDQSLRRDDNITEKIGNHGKRITVIERKLKIKGFQIQPA